MHIRNAQFFPLPYMRWTLHVPLSPAEFAARLQDVVIPRQHWWESSVALKGNFEGRVTGQDFAITRVLEYRRNSFAPILRGRFEADAAGTRLAFTLSISSFVAAPVLCWFGIVIWITGMSLASCMRSGHWEAGALIPVVTLVGGYLMVSVSFSFEANKSLRFLHDVVNGVVPQA